MSTTLEFTLHPAQESIFLDAKRFQVVAAGRRFGKSYLARVKLIVEALKQENAYGYALHDKSVYYVAPTFNQAKDTQWLSLKHMAAPVTKGVRENEGVITLVNDRQIHLKGSDRPDTLRGIGLSYVVMDEYAFMKPEVWDAIIRPTLADVKGGALFIGTPAGKNHFYTLFTDSLKPDNQEVWGAYTFRSTDNPFLDPAEIIQATKDMPLAYVKQEFEANFASFGGTIFQADWINVCENHEEGSIYISVDLAGFDDVDNISKGNYKRLDDTAISVVKVGPTGWHVLDIAAGRWNIRETSLRILRMAQKYKPLACGIEKGILKNAIMPYLRDQMGRLNTYFSVIETTHGNKRKTDRIVWALQGRLQQGRLTFQDGEYLSKLKDQLLDFPNPMTHDDMLDSLAYIDQLVSVNYNSEISEDTWAPLDDVAGF